MVIFAGCYLPLTDNNYAKGICLKSTISHSQTNAIPMFWEYPFLYSQWCCFHQHSPFYFVFHFRLSLNFLTASLIKICLLSETCGRLSFDGRRLPPTESFAVLNVSTFLVTGRVNPSLLLNKAVAISEP